MALPLVLLMLAGYLVSKRLAPRFAVVITLAVTSGTAKPPLSHSWPRSAAS